MFLYRYKSFLWLPSTFFFLCFYFSDIWLWCILASLSMGSSNLRLAQLFEDVHLCLSPLTFGKFASMLAVKLFQSLYFLCSFWNSDNLDIGPFTVFSLVPFFSLFSLFVQIWQILLTVIKCSDYILCHLHTDSEPIRCVFIFVVFFSFIISMWFFLITSLSLLL